MEINWHGLALNAERFWATPAAHSLDLLLQPMNALADTPGAGSQTSSTRGHERNATRQT